MKRLAMILAVAACLSVIPGISWAAYSMKITVSMPKGSAGEKPASTQPSSTKFSPCNSAVIDAVTFTMVYNAGTIAAADMKDVYIILYTPNGTNTTLPTYQVATTGTGVTFTQRWALSEIVPSTDIYLTKEKNLGGTITETLVAASLSLDGVPVGTWQLIGIVGDRTTINFDDPATWNAWDVGTVVLRKPWVGDTNSSCL